MPEWVRKTIKGILICTFCGSLVAQIGRIWTCTDVYCVKHDDEQARQYRIINYWNDSPVASGTVSTALQGTDLF